MTFSWTYTYMRENTLYYKLVSSEPKAFLKPEIKIQTSYIQIIQINKSKLYELFKLYLI